tara:strand:+ start:2767 stop:3651 length:885 start_codon:yes stop_codon:yes gene_type:complete
MTVRKPITKELEKAFDSNTSLGESSKRIYTSVYKRFLNLSDYTKFTDLSEENIIKIITDDSIPPKSRESLLDVAILVRKYNNASFQKLVNHRDSLKQIIQKNKLVKNEKLKGELPDKSVLELYIKTLYNEKNYVPYIVNYLLLNFGVRNLDLNLLITRDKNVSLIGFQSSINYLYVTSSTVMYIRNNYKTYRTYGQKKIKITTKNFVKACNELLGGEFDKPLLTLKNGDEISEDSIGRVIQEMTYDKLGEGKYFKINIVDAKSDNNIKKIRELSNNRGTALETVFSEYDIDNKN